jgi:type 1 glutamine amidotransferase
MDGRKQLAGLFLMLASLVPQHVWAEEAGPSTEEIAKIRSAVPEHPRVAPAKPHRLLVFSRSWGYKHTARPYGAKAIEIMAQKTRAFDVAIAEEKDLLFEPQYLKQFDGVVLNNTNEEIFLPEDFAKLTPEEQAKARQRDEMLKKSFADFVRGGGGLVVIHAGVNSFREWPEFGEIIGARFDNHPWGAGSTVVLRIEEPAHPLTAAFREPSFVVTDEIYQVTDPYSRQNLRVLVSVDPERSRITDEQKKLIHRKDMDFGMTWVKTYGKGRVFYCALGHQHELFWNPVVLQHYLDGIQFVLGDLQADTAPSAKPAKK